MDLITAPLYIAGAISLAISAGIGFLMWKYRDK